MANIFDLFKQIETNKSAEKDTPPEFIVVGLGNPGKEYENTRHNAGFLFMSYLENKLGCSINRSKFKALCGDTKIGGKRVILMKPQTFMNASGEAVIEAANFYKIPLENVIVLSDDVNLDVGRTRVRKSGSDGGQKGLRSIITCFGKDSFPRIRFGVGKKPHPDYDMVAWVLGEFSESDKKALTESFDRAYDGLCKLLNGDVDGAMQICNGK